MNPHDTPRRRPDVEAVNQPGVQALFDPETGAVHDLNPASMAIWEACDGLTEIDELAAAIATLSQARPADALQDVMSTVAQFRELGLLAE